MTDVAWRRAAPGANLIGAVRSRILALRAARKTYRRKRQVYLRTLRELECYRPHELVELGIQTGDFEELARQQAGL